MNHSIYEQFKAAIQELCERAKLREGQIVVIGCSTSEVVGSKIGTNSDPDTASELFDGIMSVLSGKDEYPTVIRAVRTSEILFIDGDDMLSIIKKYPTVAMNVMRFLADRVSFLNEKINTLSEKSTLSRLANHLLKQYRALGEVLTVSKSKLATQIDVGRASLYRDLDTLCEMKLIEVESKRIIINDPKGLERIIK
jgi:CRP-like cAMP-binding protein